MLRSFVALAVLLAAFGVHSEEKPPELDRKISQRIDIAKTLVERMSQDEFEKAVKPFDPVMARALSAGKLTDLWNGLIKQYGPLTRIAETDTESVQQLVVVYVTCEFERGKLDTKVVFNSDQEISGLFFVPSGRYHDPDYVDFSKFDEKEIETGSQGWRVPGTLSLPKGEGPFPAVILVHGSGPHDRDESIGPNKPFRDLAYGLASRGIAVLRYEKRTKYHSLFSVLTAKSITTKEETIDDVVAAVGTLETQPKIDPKRIYVLGHSLGGTLLPRIGRINDHIAGFISLAGSTRPLEDLVLEQTQYIMSLDRIPAERLRKAIAELELQVARVKSASLSEETPVTDLPLGIPPKYWLDLRGYEPAEAAKELSKPFLILQGERDYQVTMKDYALWQRSLGSRKNVTFISYPELNHLFMTGEGKSQPAEYARPGNVSERVISDIAKWIASAAGN